MLADRLDDAVCRAWTARGRRFVPAKAVVACVYRARNASAVRTLIAPVLDQGWEVRLWALDEVHPDLAELTWGVGTGAKFENCNRLLLHETDPSAWVVVLDDDIVFETADVVSLVGLAVMAELDLCQPAHEADSFHSYPVTTRVRRSVARLTGFVEIGPAFAVSPAVRSSMLPFPDVGMGWGLEAEWSKLTGSGFRIGVVDICRVRHLVLAGTDYDRKPEFERRDRFLAEHGVAKMEDLVHGTAQWRAGQLRGAPWTRGGVT